MLYMTTITLRGNVKQVPAANVEYGFALDQKNYPGTIEMGCLRCFGENAFISVF
jgi:hypothetical protein